jgi:hypothetical protein
MTYDAKALGGTLEVAFLQLRTGQQQLEAVGVTGGTERQAVDILLNLVGSCLSMAAAAELLLLSMPIPFEIARLFQVAQGSRGVEEGPDGD